MKLLTVLTARQRRLAQSGIHDDPLNGLRQSVVIEEDVVIRSDLSALKSLGDWFKLGLATPLSLSVNPKDRWLCVLIFR